MDIVYRSDISLTLLDMEPKPHEPEYVGVGKKAGSNHILLSRDFWTCQALCFMGKDRYYLAHKTHQQNLDDIINGRPDTFNKAHEPIYYNDADVIWVAQKKRNNCEALDEERYKEILQDVNMYSVILNYRFNILLDYPGKSLYIFSDDFRGVFHYRSLQETITK